MSNGAAACLPTPVAVTPREIEHQIGQAVASAATALCQGGMELQEGGRITATTKRAGAMRIYRLHELRQGNPGIDFTAIAHRVWGFCSNISPPIRNFAGSPVPAPRPYPASSLKFLSRSTRWRPTRRRWRTSSTGRMDDWAPLAKSGPHEQPDFAYSPHRGR
jgi:hypothetical protein